MKVEIGTSGKFGYIWSEPFEWMFIIFPKIGDCISLESFISQGIEFTFEEEEDDNYEILNRLIVLKKREFVFIEGENVIRLWFEKEK